MIRKTLLLCSLAMIFTGINAQYISKVIEYKPAPGQFINDASWGSSFSPYSLIGGINGTVSLGAFGGYVVFQFKNAVENDPNNPFGVDFTVFGNPLPDWAEHGVVYVMKDENGNNIADDKWYELAGSDHYFSNTIKDYQVTYINPKDTGDVPWSDNYGNTGALDWSEMHEHEYYPLAANFPSVPQDSFTLSGVKLQSEVDKSDPAYVRSYRKYFGYADSQFRGSQPYNVPDNPYTAAMENSGGDAFDISWAIDENGNHVNMDKIHFVKVQCGVMDNSGWLGEISTEITGAVDVTPDTSITGELDMIIIKKLPDTIQADSYKIQAYVLHKGRLHSSQQINWSVNNSNATVVDSNILVIKNTGSVELTATMPGKSNVTCSVSSFVQRGAVSIFSTETKAADIRLFPNPATNYIRFSGFQNADVDLYNINGQLLISKKSFSVNNPLSISDLPKGVYIIRVKTENATQTNRLIKQ